MNGTGRIVLVTNEFPSRSETFVTRLFVGLADRGWDVHVVARRGTVRWAEVAALRDRPQLARCFRSAPSFDSRRRQPVELGQTLVQLSRRPWRALRSLVRGRGGLFTRAGRTILDAPLVALAPDLVHFQFGTLAHDSPGIGRRLTCRTVVSFRGYDLAFAGLEDTGYYSTVWKGADAVHTLGHDLHQRAVARGLPDTLECRIIPPSVASSTIAVTRAKAIADGKLKLLSIGRLHWKKGHEYSLAVVAELRRRGFQPHLTVVGDGDYYEAISFARHQLGIEAEVDLAGALPHEKVLHLLADCDVFLHLAVSEGFCNAVLEAQAAGVPVVCSDADGLAENVVHGETGFVVPRRDPIAAADAVERLAGDLELRRALGRAGRARVEQHFRPEQELDAFEALYRDVLSR